MNQNNLYPIFLKASHLQIVIIGGGYVAEEKLHFLLKSSPDAQVRMVAPMFRPNTLELAEKNGVTLIWKAYSPEMIVDAHIVIATTDNPEVNEKIYRDCRSMSKLVNVADNPPLCDFYMGGIVTKGNIKVGISTNGQSPTLAKRLRQYFEEILPEEIDALSVHLNTYRRTLKNNFATKVKELNNLTEDLIKND